MMVDETVLIYGGTQAHSLMMMIDEMYTRPQSVIQIIEIPDASESNPQPVNEVEKTIGEFISAQKLKEIGGVTNLFDLHELAVKVDTSETSIGNVGAMAPNLKKLNLSNSFITSVRDLGTCLNNLNTLWLSRCCLRELDGIGCISTLKELFVAYNEILDLSPLSMMESLEVLDLEGNNIDDISQLEFLTLCTRLRILTTKGNPVQQSPTPTTDPKDLKYYSYRDAVLACLPQLTMLDDQKFLEETVEGVKTKRDNPNIRNTSGEDLFQHDFNIISQSLKAMETDVNDDSESEGKDTSTSRPMSARIRTRTAISPPTLQQKLMSAAPSPPSSEPIVSRKSGKDDDEFFEGSLLTHGDVLCGNPVTALRRRTPRKHQVQTTTTTTTTTTKQTSPLFQKRRHEQQPRQERQQHRGRPSPQRFKAEHTYLSVEEDSLEMDDVFEQLKAWRIRNQSLFGDEEMSPTSNSPTTQEKNRVSAPVYSPSPPSAPKPRDGVARPRRSFGLDGPTLVERPSTAADFRRFDVVEDVQPSADVPIELEIIDEDRIVLSHDKPSLPPTVDINNNVSIEDHDDIISRPLTARAALQTSRRRRSDDSNT